jgi:hypothetical protein
MEELSTSFWDRLNAVYEEVEEVVAMKGSGDTGILEVCWWWIKG